MPRTLTDHLAEVLELVAPLPAVTVPLDAADGLVLAQDVVATAPSPRFDNSAMDGYAVRASDVAGAGPDAPVVLEVVADLAAGTDAEPTVLPGTAARIMTGAPLPPGADTIVQVEKTDAGLDRVAVLAAVPHGTHVRYAGDDVAAGTVVLAAGTELTPYRVAAIAATGIGEVRAHRRPRVVVLSTGSELVAPGEEVGRGQLPDSNSFLLAAAARAAGAEVVRVGAVADDAAALAAVLARVSPEADLVVTSGGVSVGAYDVVKEVLAPVAGMRFVAVAMQPGKPQGLGTLDDGTPLLALPGNPVSAFVSFEVFVRPAILALRGLSGDALHRPRHTGTAEEGWSTPEGREQVIPVVVHDDGRVTTVRPAAARGSGSHLVAGLARADGLAFVPADVDRVEPGATVTVMRVDR